jgi:hypothetical protein
MEQLYGRSWLMAGGAKRAGFVAWLVTFVVPPVVAGKLGQQFVAHHPGWAVVIGVAYEVMVAVSGFFAVIARDVSSRWQSRLADRIDLFLQRKAARFERRYREFVLSGLRFMDHKGLATVGPFTPELDAVFVNVTLVPRPPLQIKPGILPDLPDERVGRRVLGDFLGRKKPVVLAVVGGPGSGKTTLLRHAARHACQRERSRRGRSHCVRDIPILLYLRDHAAAITADPSISAATLLRATLGAIGKEESPAWFEQQLRAGRCLILLDGLDEVARQEDRAKVSTWAECQVQQYPGNDFVVSSRPDGYRSAPVEGAVIVQVCGFTASQTEAFIRGWYRAAERHSTGSIGPDVEELAYKDADDLLQRLERAPMLYDLTVNPLLLTMIANVHRYRGALPGSRADLYAEICQVMLWRRLDAKKLSQLMSGDKKEAILRSLAYAMMKRRVSDLNRSDALAVIQPTLRRMSRNVIPDSFLADVSSNGLLIERETSQYAFAHKTFQEYLAAAYIRENGLVSDLAGTVSDDWWAETTLLYAATSNADPIIQACLNANTAPALALALDCTEQDSSVDPDLRKRINDLVISAGNPDADHERRRLFASILLSRHMRQRERTATGAQVCTRPIPAEIYRLFLADTQIPEPDAPLVESGIAAGLHSSDAAAFAQWAIAISGGQHSYRLPLAGELSELAARHRIPALPDGRPICLWIQPERASSRSTPTLWLPPGTSDPYEIDNALLADAGELDAARSVFTLSGLLLRSRLQIHALILTFHLDHTRDRTFDLALDLARDRGLVLVRHLTIDGIRDLDDFLALSRDLAFGRDLDRNSGLDRALARDLAGDLARARDLVRALSRHLVSLRDLDLDLDLARTRAADLALNTDLARARVLAIAIDETIDRYLSSRTAHGLNQPIFDVVCRFFLGQAFSYAISGILRSSSSSQPDRWTSLFAAAFIDAAGVRKPGRLTADPAVMEATLRDAVTKLTSLLHEKLINVPKAPSWHFAMTERLNHDARLIFARTERPTRAKATAIRMAALCLAAEADVMERKDIGDQFRLVAAGVTLLEFRASDKRRATEVVMLAVG